MVNDVPQALPPEDLARLQDALFAMLEDFDQFCKAHAIRYYIDAGTVIGACRHGGFIPWDDDIDVGMLREDYDRFLDIAATELPEGYSLHTAENTHGFAGMFAKIYKDGTVFATQETIDAHCPQALFIDIFPYDRLASDEKERTRQLRQANIWQKALYLYWSSHITFDASGLVGWLLKGAVKVAHGLIRLLFSPKTLAERFDKSRHFSGPASDLRIILAYPTMAPIPEDVLVPPSSLTFNGVVFPGPAQPETYLEYLYGSDWKELPPVEKRRTHAPVELKL